MARSRNIKPGFFANEYLVELDFATRLLFAGLWTVADKSGRLEDRPKKIKMAVFPADDVDIDGMLSALHGAGFITRYEVGGARYIQVNNWDKHQNPHHTEKASVIPDMNGEITVKAPLQPSDSPKQDGGNPADSLIPDSLIPDSLKESPPDGVPPPKPPKKQKAKDPECAEGVEPQVWADWLQLRKAKKAPVTATVLDGAVSEAAKAGMSLNDFLRIWCRRGSQGLEAVWLKPNDRAGLISFTDKRERQAQGFASGISTRTTIEEPGNVLALDGR